MRKSPLPGRPLRDPGRWWRIPDGRRRSRSHRPGAEAADSRCGSQRPRVASRRLLWADRGLRDRAIERHPDLLVRAAEQNSCHAVALLIELGFDVNARHRTASLHEAAMRGNIPIITLLLEHGADPNVRDTGYNATPAGWAEHHGQTEAQQYLAAPEERS